MMTVTSRTTPGRLLALVATALLLQAAAARAARTPDAKKLDGTLRNASQTDTTTRLRIIFRLKRQVDLAAMFAGVEATKDARLVPGVHALVDAAAASQHTCKLPCPYAGPCPCGAATGSWVIPCSGITNGIVEELQAAGATNVVPHWLDNSVIATTSPAVAWAASGRPDLQSIQCVTATAGHSASGSAQALAPISADATTSSVPANLQLIHADGAWSQGVMGTGTLVGIIDSGVYPDHALLQDNTGHSRGFARSDGSLYFWDFSGGESCGTYANGLPKPCDDIGRGTHLLSVAVGGGELFPSCTTSCSLPATAPLPPGVAPLANWVACKALRRSDDPTAPPTYYSYDSDAIANCAEWLLNPDWVPSTGPPTSSPILSHVPDVILGTTWNHDTESSDACQPDAHLRIQIQQMRALGVVPVFPVGNVDPGTDATKSVMPASFPETFSVGTYDPFGWTHNYLATDNYSGPATCRHDTDLNAPARSAPRVLAPGVNITGAWKGSPTATATLTGSDVAAAHAAGAAALVLSKFKQLQPDGTYARTLPAETIELALEHSATGYAPPTRCEDGVTACTPGGSIDDCTGVTPQARCIGGGWPVMGFTGGAQPGLIDVTAALTYEEADTVQWQAPATLGPDNGMPRICAQGAGVAPCTDDPLTCTVTLQNMGVTAWEPGAYTLESIGRSFSSVSAIDLAEEVKPCGKTEFIIPNCQAPHAPGDYVYQWQLVKGTTSLGYPTPRRIVRVGGRDVADFVSQSPETFPAPGTTGSVNVSFKNNGTTTWKSSTGYQLSNGGAAVGVPMDVPPGGTVIFPLSVSLPAYECTPWVTRPFQWLMVHSGVPGAFSSPGSPNLRPPDFDRAWIESYSLAPGGSVYEPGTPVGFSAAIHNCGGRTWDGTYCVNAGERVLGGGLAHTCASYVYPGAYFSPSGSFPASVSGKHDVGIDVLGGTYPFIATLASVSSTITVPYYWTQVALSNPYFVNMGSTGFFTEASRNNGSTWDRMGWSGTQWVAPYASDYITPSVQMNPKSGNYVAVTFRAPVAGTYFLSRVEGTDAQWSSAAGDDGVRFEADYGDPPFVAVWDFVRNGTQVGTLQSEFGIAAGEVPVGLGNVFVRIIVKPRADHGHDLTNVSFTIRGIEW